MTCPRCGRATEPTSGVCPSCGAAPSRPASIVGLATPIPKSVSSEDLTRPGREDAAGADAGDDDAATDLGLAAAFLPPEEPRTRPPQTLPPPSTDDDETNIGDEPPAAVRPTGRRGAAAGLSNPADLVGRDLGHRYHIIRLLGAGGMGAVYQAWDGELGVAVALKTIRPEVAADPGAARLLEQRFKQELLLARKVTHKNIVRVHDIGELDGVKYITMPFVDGEDLATILRREGKLPVARVLPIARGVASGLAAAHAAGVVHRDLKPANIMIAADGEGLVMDFGVARSTDTAAVASPRPGALPAALTASATAHTMAGSVVGTVEYMAPEQARAEPVDQRADVYAFGLILYDLLLGRIRPQQAADPLAELQQRMKAAPPSPRSKDASIAPALDRLIVRCLQPDAAARFQTSEALRDELARLDDRGNPLPLVRRLTWKTMAAGGALAASLIYATWWLSRPAPAVQHEPVSILIADLQNGTGDSRFDGTLEPMLKLALEGAGFISAYDRNGIRRSLGVTPPDALDEAAGRDIALKQGVGVVLSGAVARDGDGYQVAIKAAETVTGNVIVTASSRAAGADQVLSVANALGTRVRRALGETADSVRRFATDTLSAASIDVVHEYAAAMEALSYSKFDDARRRFARAVELDPNFGLAYAGMAIASANMGQPQEAESYATEAIRHVDRMTERERLRTRGLYYYVTNDYAACVKEYGDLLTRYAADAAARNNLALCSTKLRNMSRAREEMERVVQILPKRSLYRVNASLYSTYASAFDAGEQAARMAIELQDPWGQQALALAAQGLGDLAGATAAYQALAVVPGAGRSYTTSGLADIALYEGRFADAVSLFSDGAAADLAAKDGDRAAAKLAGLAFAELSRGRPRQARAAADQALAHSTAVQIRFLAGRVYAQAGAPAQARAIAGPLAAELQAEPQAYAKILDGVIALEDKDARTAVKALTEATALLDTWIGRFDLGRAYLAAGAFPQADSEFDRCLKRSGEAISLFLDEEPTSGFLPPVHYYQGLVRQGLKSAGFAEPFQRYLAIRATAGEDPLLPDIRKRLAD